MMLALPTHLAAAVMINLLSMAFIAFGMKRILFGRRYEDNVNKRVISLFVLGILAFTIGIIADTLSLFGMSSYLINHTASLVFKAIAPLCFAIATFFLRINK